MGFLNLELVNFAQIGLNCLVVIIIVAYISVGNIIYLMGNLGQWAGLLGGKILLVVQMLTQVTYYLPPCLWSDLMR